jgi:Mrp family chromosome partitioning ATPase
MSSIILTLRSPDLPEDRDLELPGDVRLERLLPELVRSLHLPPGDYRLACHSRLLEADETLVAARVLTGDVLTLLPARWLAGPADATGEPVGQDAPDDQAREVRLVDLLPSQAGPPVRHSAGTALALWSGTAGGTGQTTLALATAFLAAQQGVDVGLLALSEPSVSAHLRLPRMPNVTLFLEGGSLPAAQQTLTWEADGPATTLSVLLGPTWPGGSRAEAGHIAALVESARGAHPLVLLDLPPLTPGPSRWALEPLRQADYLVLVASPTAAGVAATVAALSAVEQADARPAMGLVLVDRAPAGLSTPEFTVGVSALWGSCPEPLGRVPFSPHLPEVTDRGELPGALLHPSRQTEPLLRAAGALLAACRPDPVAPAPSHLT